MIRYLLKRSAPTVGSTVTSDSDRYITDSNTVWVEDRTHIFYFLPAFSKTGGGRGAGHAGGKCYACEVD